MEILGSTSICEYERSFLSQLLLSWFYNCCCRGILHHKSNLFQVILFFIVNLISSIIYFFSGFTIVLVYKTYSDFLCLLYILQIYQSFTRSGGLLWHSLRFHINRIKSYGNTNNLNFFFSICVSFISFPCLLVLPRPYIAVLNIKVENVHHFMVPIIGEMLSFCWHSIGYGSGILKCKDFLIEVYAIYKCSAQFISHM